MKKIGIYIHIPFCNSKCFYCDFYSEINKEATIESYVNAVISEIMSNIEILSEYEVDSIYIGGGTPSAIDSKYISRILDCIKSIGILSYNAEITIEVNPESCSEKKIKDYVISGINRISIGLQTIHDKTLKAIGRMSNLDKFNIALKTIRENGINNISVDLIIGLPNETLEDFRKSVEYILSLNVNHISAYSLEVHPDTKLDFLIKNGFLSLPHEDIEREMKHLLDKKLEENGYCNYEISNYAKNGFEAKHNLKYWLGEYYLGFGAAAASFVNMTRYTNVSNIEKYINSISNNISCKEEIEELDLLESIKEYIILRLRLEKGVNFINFKNKFKKDILEYFKNEIDDCVNMGLLINDGEKIYLSSKGKDLANIVWQKFI